jgi:antitoxin YefM
VSHVLGYERNGKLVAQVDQFVSIAEAKNKLLDLVRNIKLRYQVVTITRYGVPTEVLLSMDQFEGFMETTELLSDSKALRLLKRSLKQAEAGKWVSDEAVFGRGTVKN